MNLEGTEGPSPYASSCDPWPWYSDPEGPYDGATPVWIEEYRGWDIWDLTEVEPGTHTYGASDPNCIGQSGFNYTLSGIRSLIDRWIDALPKGSITTYTAPQSTVPEDTVTVSATTKNTGETQGTFQLRLIDRDENVEIDSTEMFTLAAGASTTKTLTGTMPHRAWNLRLTIER